MLLAALLLSAAVQDAPRADPVAFDLRCLIIASQLRSSGDSQTSALGMAAGLFFFGRVDARLAEAEIEARMDEEARALANVDRQTAIRACGTFMSERGRALTAIGQRLEARERGRPGSQ
jgi:hypothetical protein